MTRLLVLLVVVVAVVVVAAEIVVPPRIEEVIAERVAEQVPEAESVRAELDSFPVVARGLGTGEIQRLVVTLEEVARPELTVDRVEVEVTGIEVARRALFDGEVDLERIDRGELTAVITEADLEAALPVEQIDLTLTPGRAEATVLGQTAGSDVEVVDGQVRFDLGPLPDVSVALPGPDFFPCTLEGEVVAGAVELGCTLERVPDYLLRRLEGAWSESDPAEVAPPRISSAQARSSSVRAPPVAVSASTRSAPQPATSSRATPTACCTNPDTLEA